MKHGAFLNNTFLDFLLSSLTPLLLVFSISVISIIVSLNAIKLQIKQDCTAMLQQYAVENTSKIEDSVNATNILTQAYELSNYLFTNNAPLSNETLQIIENVLDTYPKILSTIDNIFIFNKQNNTVISASGLYTAEFFFESVYSYSEYSPDYWKQFIFWDNSPYRVLSPTYVSSSNDHYGVVPIVLQQINHKRSYSYIIINLKTEKLLPDTSFLLPTASANFYMLNCYSKKVFSNNINNVNMEIDNVFYSKLFDGESFDTRVNNINSLIVSYTYLNGLNGFIYYSVIPYNDIYKTLYPLYIFLIIVMILTILVSLFIALKNTHSIYLPLKTLVTTLDIDLKEKKLASLIYDAETSALQKNKSLSTLLPYALEQYLVNFLNSFEYAMDEQCRRILQHSLPFKYNYFSCLIIQFYPTDDMHNDFSESEIANIRYGLYDLVKSLFSAKFYTLILSRENESLEIILNLNSSDEQNNINKLLDNVLLLFKNDTNYMKLYFGGSNIYKGLAGLRKAHSEAFQNLKFVPQTNDNTRASSTPTHNILKASDETKLYDCLNYYRNKETIELITSYKNKYNDPESQKILFAKFLNIILKVMQNKKIAYSDCAIPEYEFVANVMNMPNNNIYQTILELIYKINSISPQNDTTGIISFIANNYTNKELSLEYISAIYNTTPSYTSVLVKNKINIGFHEYLTNLRINQAKLLLQNTNKSIQEICDEVGFNSHTTFFRCFKQATGMTPRDFRNMK